ncbi:MAG TPA: cupin domain-containing protein [Candidatus Acidoferrales bacterium]|nr:cupin domain-containing protein [Candidatus Acidoferrales bacterium]
MTVAQKRVAANTDSVRITIWTFEPGSATDYHRHEFDYVVVPVSGGTFTITAADGVNSEMTQMPGAAYTRPAGTEHDVANAGSVPAVFVEVEMKSAKIE